MKVIKINEEQYRFIWENIISEGVDFKNNGDGTINMSINQDKTDKNNLGTNKTDTRIFGSKNNILYGDGTNNYINSLDKNYRSSLAAIKFYQSIIDYIKNGRQGEIYSDQYLNTNTYNNGIKWLDGGADDQYIINTSLRKINDLKLKYEQYSQKVNRVNNEPNENKIERYNTGTVQGTDIKYIALFYFTDFNFSDGIKHGELRQNNNTNNVLDITTDQRVMNGRSTSTIPVTYDGKYKPNVAQNFSLNNVPNDHYKQQYGLNGEGGYNSITQFMDKSIIYAKHVLNKEGFKPDYIISVPSSSKYNEYYSINLSNKLGVEYVKDFFQRNLVNVYFDDGQDTEKMRNAGFSTKQITEFATKVKNGAYAELSYILSYDVRQFVNNYRDFFNKLPVQKSSREKFDLNTVIDCLMRYIFTYTTENLNNISPSDMNFTKILIENFKDKNIKVKTSSFNADYLMTLILNQMKNRQIKPVFDKIVMQTKNNILQYVDKIKNTGYYPRWNTQKFKITHFDKAERPFLKGVYIVADKNCNKNGDIFSRYKNAKFLIFDEDMNSGTSLKLSIDALENKIPDINHNNICCLVNAIANTGKV